MANVTAALAQVAPLNTQVGSLTPSSVVQLGGVRAQTRIAVIGDQNSYGRVSMALPSLSVWSMVAGGVTGSVALTLPLKLSMSGGGSSGVVPMRLPSFTLQASGLVGASGAVRLALPTPRLQMLPANSVALQIPRPNLTTSGTTGVIGSVSMRLPSPSLAIAASAAIVGGVSLALPSIKLAISASAGQTAAVALTLKRLALAAEGRTGVVGNVTLTLPVMRFAAQGQFDQVGVAQLTLPSLNLSITGRVAAGPSQTTVMHTETMALTQYSNFPFNSFAQFNGVTLGASDQGLFALTGATDNGTPIDAFARVGITDFNTSHLKRVDRIYVGYRSDGNLVMRVLTDETQQRDYLLRASGAGLHGNHVRLGKGLEARYWQFEVRNLNGADFDLNTIELKPTTLKRRIGGWDA